MYTKKIKINTENYSKWQFNWNVETQGRRSAGFTTFRLCQIRLNQTYKANSSFRFMPSSICRYSAALFVFLLHISTFLWMLTIDLSTHYPLSYWGPDQSSLGWCLCNSCTSPRHFQSVANLPWRWEKCDQAVNIYTALNSMWTKCKHQYIFFPVETYFGDFSGAGKPLKRRTKKLKWSTEHLLKIWSDRKCFLVFFTFSCSVGGG